MNFSRFLKGLLKFYQESFHEIFIYQILAVFPLKQRGADKNVGMKEIA